jgi:LuxR family maltose regulon positive regulatory protein
MDPRLITSKLQPARNAGRMIVRQRLLTQLTDPAGHPLTLIAAPAGYGKSSLLSMWASQQPEGAVAWLALDPADNDPVRFCTYLVVALRIAVPSLDERLPEAAPMPGDSWLADFLPRLLAALDAAAQPLTLVLEDYHVIHAASIHELIASALAYGSTQLRLIIASRSDPPLPLPRLRAHGQLAELRASDLAFTYEETRSFLEVQELKLPKAQLAAVHAATEGWIAGLQLAALSVDRRAGVPVSISAVSGRHRHVFDYFLAEVLERQPVATRTFLLATSILERLTAPLCDMLTGGHDGAHQLAALEQQNLFLVPLDAERQWYRYHHLFREALQARLAMEAPAMVRALHLRASEWYERQGAFDQAIEHALGADAPERAAALIEQSARTFWSCGEVMTLRGWLSRLAPATLHASPRLVLECGSSAAGRRAAAARRRRGSLHLG